MQKERHRSLEFVPTKVRSTGQSTVCRSKLLSALFLNFIATIPAYANGTVQLPEPSSLVLFAIGATGLLVGRRLAIKRSSDKD
jgi:hypothetical protein